LEKLKPQCSGSKKKRGESSPNRPPQKSVLASGSAALLAAKSRLPLLEFQLQKCVHGNPRGAPLGDLPRADHSLRIEMDIGLWIWGN
jgi:hypothetical protein